MFNALKNLLGIRTTDGSKTSTGGTFLFSGSAHFSNRVPMNFTEEWVSHGGESASGRTRAWYFFAIDPLEPWVKKLSAKSVIVIHAGWIMHCVDEAFRVPIAEYILDDRFVPGPPYKLTSNTPPVCVPSSTPGEPTDIVSVEPGSTSVHTSDTPSTPPSMPRKRKHEEAYFDSPSGSLVFSGFDKNGIPLRPRKIRKLRFDPSFSPEDGELGQGARRGTTFDWPQDRGEFKKEHDIYGGTSMLCGQGHMTTVQSPDTPHKREEPAAALAKSTCVSSLTISVPAKIPPVRTIDFTKLPPPTRRWRFQDTNATKSGHDGTILSIAKPADDKVKTPKKISFADHAHVCVYPVSPQLPGDVTDGDTAAGPRLGEAFELEVDTDPKTRIWALSDRVDDSDDDSMADVIRQVDIAPGTNLPSNASIDDPARLLGDDPSESDTLIMTMEDVQAMRRRLLESTTRNEVDDGQPLATLFELGKTCRGKAFRHVW